MSVNGIDVLKLSLQEAFDVLKDAAFPKRLKWRRLIDLSEDLTIQARELIERCHWASLFVPM